MPIINAQDLEIVKLTALYVAKRGKGFMTALSQRETRNYQFDFLRPQNRLYQFFTRLVDQYTIVLRSEGLDKATSENQRMKELEHNVRNKYHVLDRANQRAEWVKFQGQQKLKKEEAEEQERMEYAQIDWHDFVVVETVLFTETDDHTDLPPPTSLNDLQSASLEQKAMMSLNPLRIEEAMPTEEMAPNYYNSYPAQPQPQPSYPQQPQLQPQPQPAQYQYQEEEARIRAEAQAAAAAAQASAQATASPTPEQARANQFTQPMRIRSDYVPRAQARRINAAGTALCPNCHQQIPTAELEQHMRIELLDPRWKEQRAKAESRTATTNLATADVAHNLKRLASQRSDVFDSSLPGGTAAAAGDAEEEARRKRMATHPPGYEAGPAGGVQRPTVGPAGQPGQAGNPQDLNIEEQIRRIHERHGQ